MNRNIIIWNIYEKSIINKIIAHDSAIVTLDLNLDNTILFSASWNNQIKIWNFKENKLELISLREFQTHQKYIPYSYFLLIFSYLITKYFQFFFKL